MKLEISRKRRSQDEGVALYVSANNHDQGIPWQFKIDVWSLKGSGHYTMRLDGFGFLGMWNGRRLEPLLANLRELPAQHILFRAREIHQMMTKAWAQLPEEQRTVKIPDLPELEIVEYFEAARNAMVKELEPLVEAGVN